MESIDAPYLSMVSALYNEGLKGDALANRLKENGLTDEAIEACLALAKKLHYAHLQKIGVKLLGLGVFLCATSGLFTFLYNHPDAFANMVLFGLTGIGACFVLGGLAYIFGL